MLEVVEIMASAQTAFIFAMYLLILVRTISRVFIPKTYKIRRSAPSDSLCYFVNSDLGSRKAVKIKLTLLRSLLYKSRGLSSPDTLLSPCGG